MNILFLEFMFMLLSSLTETFCLWLHTEHFAVGSEFALINYALVFFDVKFIAFLDFLGNEFKILIELSCKFLVSFTDLRILLTFFNVMNLLQVSSNPAADSLSIQFSINFFFGYFVQFFQFFMQIDIVSFDKHVLLFFFF